MGCGRARFANDYLVQRKSDGGIIVRMPNLAFLVETMAFRIEKIARQRFSDDLRTYRPGVFPLISADTFRSLANQVVDEDQAMSLERRFNFDIAFLDMRFFQRGPASVHLEDIPGFSVLQEATPDKCRILLIANADIPPSREQLQWLSERFDHVFCTNITQEVERISPIPVGIENLYRLSHGLPWQFLSRRAGERPESRPQSVFACFSISTNRLIRSPLKDALVGSRHGFCDARLAPLEFQSRLAKAKFVVSPPGNGPDCHRTWEAIYMGAVPVILKGTLPEKFVRNLPILEVEDYVKFLEYTDEELESLFVQFQEKSREMAYMPYWVNQIIGIARRQDS